MGKLDHLLLSGEQVLHRSPPGWRGWAWIMALGLGTALFSVGVEGAMTWFGAGGDSLGAELIEDLTVQAMTVGFTAAILALGSLPPQYLLTTTRLLYRRHPLGRILEILKPDIDSVGLNKDTGLMVLNGRHPGAIRRRRGASTVPVSGDGGTLRLRKIDRSEDFARALGVPVVELGRKELDPAAQNMWVVCLFAGLVPSLAALLGGVFALQAVYDAIWAIDGISVRAGNFLYLGYLLGMVGGSALAFYGGLVLALVAARRSLSADQMRQVIYLQALGEMIEGAREPTIGPVKARMLFFGFPVDFLSALYGESLRLDAQGLEALLATLPLADAAVETSADRA